MSPEQILATIESHEHWLRGRPGCVRADLRKVDARGLTLELAVLSKAALSGIDLRCSVLRGADLSAADLFAADLTKADLSGANLTGADLKGAQLYKTKLTGAKLKGADARSISALRRFAASKVTNSPSLIKAPPRRSASFSLAPVSLVL